MLSWLRSQILTRKAAAEALPHGPWHIEGRYPQTISNAEAIVIAETFEGPQFPPSIARHIVAHDPQDTIARCKAELALLADHSDFDFPANDDDGPGGYSWTAHCDGCGQPTPCRTVRLVASGYRHRPGWLPEWAPETA